MPFSLSTVGPLSNTVAQTIGFFRIPQDDPVWRTEGLKDPAPGPNSPHYELVFGDGFVGAVDVVPDVGNFFTIATVGLATISKGSITLKSSDPLAEPLIDPNFFKEEIDIVAAVHGELVHLLRREQIPNFFGHHSY